MLYDYDLVFYIKMNIKFSLPKAPSLASAQGWQGPFEKGMPFCLFHEKGKSVLHNHFPKNDLK